MIVEALHEAIIARLGADAAFGAALTARIDEGGIGLKSLPTVLRSNLAFEDIRQIHASRLPCWVIEAGGAIAGPLTGLTEDERGLTLGGGTQAWRCEVLLGLVWHENDRERAYTQRLRLATLVPDLFLRNPDLGVDNCAGCLVVETEPDQGLNHPWQNWRALLAAELILVRS